MNLKVNIDSYIGKDDFFSSGFSLSKLKSLVEDTPDAERVVLYINSEGGSVTEGFAIHDYLKNLNKPVDVVIEGMCASIATIIALSAPRERRSMYANASIMIHNPYWTPEGPIGMEASDLETLAADLRANEDKITEFYNSHLTIDAEVIKEKMKAETWIYAAEALELGFVGTVINDKVMARKLGTIKAQIFNQNKNEMKAEFSPAQTTWLETQFSKLSNMLKGTKQNMTVKLKDGSEIIVDSEDGDLLGKTVTKADGSPADNGSYVSEDGRTIVVADGVVSEVVDAPEEDALKVENEELKAEVARLAAEMAAKEADFQNRITTFTAEFEAFKNTVVTGKIEVAQNFGGPAPKKSQAEQALEYRKSKQQTV